MARTSLSKIRLIMSLSDSDSAYVTAAIEIASSLVDEICVAASLSDSRKEMIERYIAAHFVRINLRKESDEKADTVAASYEAPKFDMFLNGTAEGQQALILDTSGALAAYQGRLKQMSEEGAPGSITVQYAGGQEGTCES